MKKFFVWALALPALVFVLSGCRSDAYYQDRAVQRARAFLLKNAPELTPEQSYFVKFNRPVLLVGGIFDRRINEYEFGSELKQVCVTWNIPGIEEDYLVFGTSTGRMDYWFPERLIRKKFERFSLPIESAMRIARTYAQNYLYPELGRHEFNYIRFGFPYVIRTSFELTVDPDGTASAEEQEKNRTALERNTQVSLVWKFPEDGGCMVFCGTGKADLTGWAINFAGRMTEEELERMTLEVLKTPENAQTPIDLPETDDMPAATGFGVKQAEQAVAPGAANVPARESADDIPAPPEGNMVNPIVTGTEAQ